MFLYMFLCMFLNLSLLTQELRFHYTRPAGMKKSLTQLGVYQKILIIQSKSFEIPRST